MKKFHILLVEDNPADADLTIEILSATNDVEVSLAKDGIEALTLLEDVSNSSQSGRPTLICSISTCRAKTAARCSPCSRHTIYCAASPLWCCLRPSPILISPTATSWARTATSPSRWTCKRSDPLSARCKASGSAGPNCPSAKDIQPQRGSVLVCDGLSPKAPT